MAIRRAQLVAEAVSVLCPYCGDVQPSNSGSEMWTAEDFLHKVGIFPCVSCDKDMLITSDTKAQFQK